MNFWIAVGAYVVACAVVYMALSINGKTEQAGGHDSHDHGHGAHAHH
jgi:hypothetical protein